MMNYHDKRVEADFLATGVTRTHPWISALSDESQVYYNFIENPELIETTLEDFLPFNNYQAVQTFYELLRWLNGKDSIFESNDSALLKEVEKNTDNNTPEIARQTYRISGRLIFFFRDHILNADKKACNWLWNDLPHEFDRVDPKFNLGIVGFSKVLTAYQSLPDPLSKLSYVSICLTFFAWGVDENSTMDNLQRVYKNTLTVLKKLSQKGILRRFPQSGQVLLQKASEGDSKTLEKLSIIRKF